MSDGSLRQQLRSTIDHLAQQPAARKLCLALALADGFQFQVVVCNTTRLSAALQLWLEEVVTAERGSAVVIDRLSPYPLDWRAAGPGQLGEDDLAQLVLAQLVGERGVTGRVVVIDAARASASDADAWRTLIRRLNERRNMIARDLMGPLTLILSPALDVEFARLAPDLWSIRSVAVTLHSFDEPTPLLHAFDLAGSTLEDVPALMSEVERLRPRASAGSQAAMRSLQVLLLRLAGNKQRVGEITEAEQLIDEAAALAEQLSDPEAQAACRLALSELTQLRGDYDRALALIDEAVLMTRDLDDEWALADAWGRRADVLVLRGELDEALRIRMEKQLPVYERLGDTRSWTVTRGRIADILQERGEFDEALRIRKEEELPAYERLGDVHSRAATMGKVADILRARGELDEALRIRIEEELPVYEQLGDVRERAVTLGKIADILQERGEFDEALRIRTEEQLPAFEQLGDVRSRAVTLGRIADTLQANGELDEALSVRRDEELPVYEQLGDLRSQAVTLGKVANIFFARDEFDEAARIHRDEELPALERLGDVRSLLVGRANLAITLLARQLAADGPEIVALLVAALRDARRLRLPEVRQLADLVRQLGLDPDAPPFV